MKKILILLLKMIIILFTLIFLPFGYFYLKIKIFIKIMSTILNCKSSISLYIRFFILKILLISYVIYVSIFLSVVNLFMLVLLIHAGIVY